jgi:hypothetical protein
LNEQANCNSAFRTRNIDIQSGGIATQRTQTWAGRWTGVRVCAAARTLGDCTARSVLWWKQWECIVAKSPVLVWLYRTGDRIEAFTG